MVGDWCGSSYEEEKWVSVARDDVEVEKREERR